MLYCATYSVSHRCDALQDHHVHTFNVKKYTTRKPPPSHVPRLHCDVFLSQRSSIHSYSKNMALAASAHRHGGTPAINNNSAGGYQSIGPSKSVSSSSPSTSWLSSVCSCFHVASRRPRGPMSHIVGGAEGGSGDDDDDDDSASSTSTSTTCTCSTRLGGGMIASGGLGRGLVVGLVLWAMLATLAAILFSWRASSRGTGGVSMNVSVLTS